MKDPGQELILVKAIAKDEFTVKEVLISAQAVRLNNLPKGLIKPLTVTAINDRCVYLLFRAKDLAYGGIANFADLAAAAESPLARKKFLAIGIHASAQLELKSLYLTREKGGHFQLIFQTRDFTSLKARLKPGFGKLIKDIAAGALA